VDRAKAGDLDPPGVGVWTGLMEFMWISEKVYMFKFSLHMMLRAGRWKQ